MEQGGEREGVRMGPGQGLSLGALGTQGHTEMGEIYLGKPTEKDWESCPPARILRLLLCTIPSCHFWITSVVPLHFIIKHMQLKCLSTVCSRWGGITLIPLWYSLENNFHSNTLHYPARNSVSRRGEQRGLCCAAWGCSHCTVGGHFRGFFCWISGRKSVLQKLSEGVCLKP